MSAYDDLNGEELVARFKKAMEMLTEFNNKYSKEAEMNEDMAKPDYKQLCEEYECKIDELNKQNEELQKKNEAMSDEIEFKANYIARLEGYTRGLEFAIRCNGVSGAEVKFE